MTSELIIAVLCSYFLLLILISFFTGKNADQDTFFKGNRNSPWFLVAFGMIGASLSGVTFISVPGWVQDQQFAYMQMVLGYFVGYMVIVTILMPLYYKLNLTSIYGYLESRFGFFSYKTGAICFLVSRTIGAAFRLFLTAVVLHSILFRDLGVPFPVTVFITIALIYIYTFRGGIKTVVWTDTLQTAFMLFSAGLAIYLLAGQLDLSFDKLVAFYDNSPSTKIFFWDDFSSGKHFIKMFFSGMFITIVMTGLDQDMMQKNLTCKSLGDAQKNMVSFSVILIAVNFFFLLLGALLYLYAAENQVEIPARTDELFPILAMKHLGPAVGITFLLGLVAAAYSSADSAVTALTTSFCVDILNFEKKNLPQNIASANTDKKLYHTRLLVHVGFSILLFLVILVFQLLDNEAVIKHIFTFAGYTYGPLLGLYGFGLFTKLKVKDRLVPVICLSAPVLTILLDYILREFMDFNLGFFILILNGLITFIGMLLIADGKVDLPDTEVQK